MLTTLENYHDFLVYYYNLGIKENLLDVVTKFSMEYALMDHNLKVYPQYYQSGSYLVPDELKSCFLIWWREKSLDSIKGSLH